MKTAFEERQELVAIFCRVLDLVRPDVSLLGISVYFLAFCGHSTLFFKLIQPLLCFKTTTETFMLGTYDFY
jgi:hypothetical protein